MKIGDLVSVRNHPNHLGVITDLSESHDHGWITVLWFNDFDDGLSEFKIPLSSAHHIEVIK